MTFKPPDVEAIFNEARVIPPDERIAFLDEVCGDDIALRRRVEQFLAAQAEIGSFLEAPLVAMPAPVATIEMQIAEGPGAVIGPYTLIKQIGEGGFGVVFMAEQTQPVRRNVALKVLKPGMDTRQVVARFEAERQALAIMDHPNIAKVLDGGATATGRPYFVMELVKGVPITEYCDQNHLTPWQRLELFIPVCQAVQHAHQKGIIHRDIKPSNVLIADYDKRPVPKVIDFGVAKATGSQLTQETLQTGFGAVVGTVEYMSPEQASLSQLDVDTRTDIYSLGVLLYELLTGTTPLDRKRLKTTPLLDVLRIIREDDTVRPSARLSTVEELRTIAANRGVEPKKLSGLMRGELDWIVMKALDKDRARRYESADALAADVHRYLNDESVEACPPTPMYRFRKFARRNKAVLATATLVGVLLAVTSTVLAVSNVRIDQALEDRGRAFGELDQQQKKVTKALDDVTKLLGKLKEEQKQTKQALYFHSVALADREWWLGNVDKVETILDQCPLEHRDWEWHFLKRRCRTNSILFRAKTPGRDWPKAVLALSPNGEFLACCELGLPSNTVTQDWGLRVWNTQSGKEVLQLAIPVGQLSQFAIRQDNQQLAIPTTDWGKRGHALQVLDLQTGTKVFSIPAPGPLNVIQAVAYCPFGKELAFGTNTGIVSIHDADTGKQKAVLKAHQGGISGLSYHPDGERLATAGSDKMARVWDIASGKQLFEMGHTSAVTSVTYNVAGHRLATASMDGWRTFDAESGKSLLTLPLDPEHEARRYGSSQNIVFSGDSQHLLVAGQDRSLRVLNAETGREIFRMPGHLARVTNVLWGSGQLASWSEDGTLRLWPAAGPSVFARRDFVPMAISDDGKTLAGRFFFKDPTYDTLDVINIKSGLSKSKVAAPLNIGHSATLSPDGAFIATRTSPTSVVGKRPYLLHVRSTTVDQTENVHLLTTAAPISVAFRPHANQLAIADSHHHVLKICAVPSGNQIYAIAGEVVVVKYSRDGRYLAGICQISDRRLVKVWDAATGKEVRDWNVPATTTALAFSSDGELLAIGGGNRLRVCHVNDDQSVEFAFSEPVVRFAFIPNSRRLATWSGDDTVLRIRDLDSGREVLTLRGHNEGVHLATISGDGMLTTVDGKGNVRQFDGRRWEEDSAEANGPANQNGQNHKSGR